MTRNYFSKHGGPYFVNDGFSKHDHDHKPNAYHEDIKPDLTFFYALTIVFVSLILAIGITLAVLP